MPDLAACTLCGQPIPTAAPAGQCPGCLLRLGLASTGRADDTPVSGTEVGAPTREFAGQLSTLDARRPTGNTTADGPDAGLRTTAPDGPLVERGRAVRFGNYELFEELGRGGMGVVFRAVQAVADREVAVKVLLGGAAGGAVHGGRFAAEVQALAHLRHPNIVTVYEVGEADGSAFFSMEYAPHGTLAGRLKGGPLDPREAAGVVAKLADATEAAHQLGVLHRDIKPGNVLVAADGEPKLSDFGLAKWTTRNDGLTASGAVMGTPSYMPPEQVRAARDVTATADVYSLGATLYECLTGVPPFRGDDSYVIVQRVLVEEPRPPRQVRADVPAELEAVCLKCLEKDPARRYASAAALADDLRRWLSGTATAARPWSRAKKVRHAVRRRWKLAVAVAVLLVGVGVTFAVWYAPLRRLNEALARGERVELVGATGPPKWHRWAVGTGEFPPTEANLPFVVATDGVALLELAPDTPADEYRLTAEFRTETSTQRDSWGGVYFAWRRNDANDAGRVGRAILARYFDDRQERKPLFEPPTPPSQRPWGDPVSVEDCLIIHNATHPQGFVDPTPLASRMEEESARDKRAPTVRPWRAIEVEVRADTVTVRWRAPTGEWVPVRPSPDRPPDTIAVRTMHGSAARRHEDQLRKHFPELSPNPPPYAARGAVGLYAQNGTVAFRNVVLEPLDPPHSP